MLVFHDPLKIKAYQFSKDIVVFVASLPSKKVFWIIGDQLLRSGTSICANLVEAQSGSSPKDFARYFEIALKSSNESLYWLQLMHDTQDYKKAEITVLVSDLEEIAKLIAASLKTIRSKFK